ncbi:hypothetical protein AAHB33_13950 [Paenarthrobacter sp. S56]|uniref:hypothetical protein n=1 Tax=Paenarthrobacter sp. S56 TaxID=3138179 RepID=UPI00321B1DC4
MGTKFRVACGVLAVSVVVLGPVAAASAAATFVEDPAAGSYGSISSDGKFIAFMTSKSLSADTNTLDDLYVRDVATNAVSLASSKAAGAAVGVNGASEISMQGTIVVSDDGETAVFLSSAANVVAEVADTKSHVYKKDQATGATVLLDRTTAGAAAAADANSYRDGYLWEKATGKPRLLSTNTTGSAIGSVVRAKISGDGAYAAYSHFVTGCGCYDLTRVALGTGAKLNITNSAAKAGTLTPAYFSISRTGKYIAFETNASYETGDSTNKDIYAWSSTGTYKRLTKPLSTLTQPSASQISNKVGLISEAQGLVSLSSNLKLTTTANTATALTQTAYLASITSNTVEALKPTKAGTTATHLKYTTAIDDAGRTGLVDGSYSLFKFTR